MNFVGTVPKNLCDLAFSKNMKQVVNVVLCYYVTDKSCLLKGKKLNLKFLKKNTIRFLNTKINGDIATRILFKVYFSNGSNFCLICWTCLFFRKNDEY